MTILDLVCEIHHLGKFFPTVCGRENIDQRIVGGKEVNPQHRYPWMVAFLNTENKPFCAGSILNREFILTAAHCFDNYMNNISSLDAIKVLIGVHSVEETAPNAKIESLIIHEEYKRTGQALFNDIALVKLAKPLTFNAFSRPICLPSRLMTSFDNLTVAGWGFIREEGPTSLVLKEVALPYIPNHICEDFHGEVITSSMVCAGGNQNQDSCQGDSGAPLMFWRYGHIYVVGLVSFGLGCGRPSYYGVYTRVSSYLNWIYERTENSTYCARPPKILPSSEPPTSNSSSTTSEATESPTTTTTTTTTTTAMPTSTTTTVSF